MTATISLLYIFSPNWRDTILVAQERKHLSPTNFPSYPSLQLNTNKTVLSPLFSLLFSILSISTPTKRTVRLVYMTIRLPMIHVSEQYIFTLHRLVVPSPFHSRCMHWVIQIERFWVAILDNQHSPIWFWIFVLRLLNSYSEFS